MSKKRISKEKSIRHAKTTTEIVISLVLLGSCGLFVKNAFTDITKVEQSPYFDNNNIEQDLMTQTTEPDPNQVIYESLSVETKNKFYGDLILINRDHEYFTSFNEDLVNIYDMNVENNCHCFSIVDTSYTILRQVYGPMSKMIQDFYDIYANDTLEIYGSYRTKEFQDELYQKDLASTGESDSKRVAPAGFSEHESGLAFDFTETENYDYNGEGDFAWLNANCYKYGFIVRYTRSKESITKFRDEPWHFRYVGKPHAYYMDSHDLCLEEYIDLLRKYPYSGEHLEFSDDKNDYEIYFVAADDSSEKTSIPVPNGERYEISGNNVDGFIVTVYKGQKPIVEEVTTKEFEDVSGDLSGSENENGDSGDQSEDDYE
ncbi:M15 family metallopeptidase [Ruminococcus sp.]|uniref:M15 family metallopeptidase n=1 Tax=Ruminococcus sp. TaxID=41978 RepID=UPI0025D6EA48|nr:M15 family metallopeptidase [Ruminococcus sp.]